MQRLALLLRGINVGGHTKVAMSDLKELLASLGYDAPKTLLNSGNAIVTTSQSPAEAEHRVSDALAKHTGKRIEVMARTHDELAAVVAANPLAEYASKPNYLVVAFLGKEPAPGSLDHVNPADYEPERWALLGRELFIWYANGQAKTKITAGFFQKHVKLPATARNWNTVLKLRDATA